MAAVAAAVVAEEAAAAAVVEEATAVVVVAAESAASHAMRASTVVETGAISLRGKDAAAGVQAHSETPGIESREMQMAWPYTFENLLPRSG